MPRSAYSRRALALALVCAILLTVAAEASVKDNTRIRVTREEAEEKLQVGARPQRISLISGNVVFVRSY